MERPHLTMPGSYNPFRAKVVQWGQFSACLRIVEFMNRATLSGEIVVKFHICPNHVIKVNDHAGKNKSAVKLKQFEGRRCRRMEVQIMTHRSDRSRIILPSERVDSIANIAKNKFGSF